jgi:polyisoprenoid-binding protein YceI
LWSEASKLTTHLKSPDFFDTKENPDIKFESTMVEGKQGANATVTGNLTLHGVTKTITVPVTVSVTKEGVTLAADFKIDRTEFGMSFEPDKIDKTVSLTVIVGEKNDPKPGA